MRHLLSVLLLLLCAIGLGARDLHDPSLFDHPVSVDDSAFRSTLGRVADGSPWVASFTQVKQIHGVKRTFKSTGTMLLQPGKGIAWLIEKPFASEMVVGSDYLLQRLPGGAETRMELGENPIFTTISQTISLLFQGDPEALDEAFHISFSTEDGRWYLALKPKKKEIASFVESFIMEGEEVVEGLVMAEKNGDSVTYLFDHIEKRSLTDAEASHF